MASVTCTGTGTSTSGRSVTVTPVTEVVTVGDLEIQTDPCEQDADTACVQRGKFEVSLWLRDGSMAVRTFSNLDQSFWDTDGDGMSDVQVVVRFDCSEGFYSVSLFTRDRPRGFTAHVRNTETGLQKDYIFDGGITESWV